MPDVLTTKDMAEYLSREMTRRNGKIVPKLPNALARLCSEAHFYLFNVGPWEWSRQLSGRGTRTLQPCPEGQKYSEPLTLPFMDNETVAADMNKMENRQEDGQMVVDAFLMEGYGFRPEMSLRNWGVGVITHWPPKAEDLVEPNRLLNLKFDQMIAEADAHHQNHKPDDISDMHRMAARRRKQDRPWLNAGVDVQSCPACGSNVRSNIAACPHCTAVLNEELHRKYFPEKYKKAV